MPLPRHWPNPHFSKLRFSREATEYRKDFIVELDGAFADRRVLITGALGFIGSNLARRLTSIGARVLLVDSLVPQYGVNLFNIAGIAPLVQVNVSDVRGAHSMRYLVQGQDYLFNLAGQTSHMDSMSDPDTDLEINCRAQLSILEACRKYNPSIKVVFASTSQLYANPIICRLTRGI